MKTQCVILIVFLVLFFPSMSCAQSFADFFTVTPAVISEDSTYNLSDSVLPGPAFTDGGFLPDLIGSDVAYQNSLYGTTTFDFSALSAAPTSAEVIILGSQTAGSSNNEENTYLGSIKVNFENGTYSGQLIYFDDVDDPLFSWVEQSLGLPASSAEVKAGIVDANLIDVMVSSVGSTLTITHMGTNAGTGANTGPDQLAFLIKYENYLEDSLTLNGVTSFTLDEAGSTHQVVVPIDADTSVININGTGGDASSDSTIESIITARITLNKQDDNTFLAAGVVHVVDGIGDDRVTSWAFKDYTVLGDLSGTSGVGVAIFLDDAPAGVTVVGDVDGLTEPGGSTSADVTSARLGPKLYFDGAGNLVIEQRSTITQDWTVQWNVLQIKRNGAPTPLINERNASIINVLDTVNNDVILGGLTTDSKSVKMNDPASFRLEVPIGATFGDFRLAESTLQDVNENRFMLDFQIDFSSNTTTGSSIGRRASSPDFVAWADVPFGTKLVTTSGLATGVFSNRTTLNQFVDDHVGGITIDFENNPDGDGRNYLRLMFDAPGNQFSSYVLDGAVATFQILNSARFTNISELATFIGGQAAEQPDGSLLVPVIDLQSGNVSLKMPDNFNSSFDIELELATNTAIKGQVTVDVLSNTDPNFDQENDGVGLGAVPENEFLSDIIEGNPDPAGSSIGRILRSSEQSGFFTPNQGIRNGIAITSFTLDSWSQGNASTARWQYSQDGVAWIDVGPVSPTSALLLRNEDLLRYVLDDNTVFGGVNLSATISYLAWDQTGTADANGVPVESGNKVDTTQPITDGSPAVLSALGDTAIVNLIVTNFAPFAVNDGPITTQDDTPVTIPVLTNDSDPNDPNSALFITEVNGQAITPGGAAVTTDAGSFTLSGDSRT